jgi:hypothetical protein
MDTLALAKLQWHVPNSGLASDFVSAVHVQRLMYKKL